MDYKSRKMQNHMQHQKSGLSSKREVHIKAEKRGEKLNAKNFGTKMQ